ncbi:Non-specific serine/threonine protein kinase [Bertholletia excelsa]
MDEAIWHTQKWQVTKHPETFFTIYIAMLAITLNFQVSWSSRNDCILNFHTSSSSYNSSSQWGQWGGFLKNNYCGGLFHDYLYALGVRANQTGKIYLNSTEQRNCLMEGENAKDVLGCGIEKLTSGLGECSNFSVDDVNNKLGDEIRSLGKNCQFLSSVGESGQPCSSCLRSWKAIQGAFPNENGKSLENGSEICMFTVLISLTSSRIEDQIWVRRIYHCLADQDSKEDTPSLTASKSIMPEESGCLKISAEDVYAATNNLHESNFIGEGTAGEVYKGILPNERHVAVKHINNEGHAETFLREVKSLSKIRHPNLVALLGYCRNKGEFFLVYELCPNGDLSEWLFGKEKILSWIQRLLIAIDSAKGLWFLHTYPEGCIVHRDIKPTNILLGTNFEAKLSDFGLSKVLGFGESYVSSEVRGTFGYLDPEYQSNCQVNSSGDIYSFGIVLLQIISGNNVINMNLRKPMPLNKMARSISRQGGIARFADPKLNGDYSSEAFNRVFDLALSCTGPKQQRPSMEEVVLTLEEALHISTRAIKGSPSRTEQTLNQPSAP